VAAHPHPADTASLIIAFGVLVQGYVVWKLRHALRWQRLWPLIAGTGLGVPLGVWLLAWVQPNVIRVAIGVLLIVYAICGLRGRHSRR